jgi:hypothetical protein
MTCPEVAQRLGITVVALFRLIDAGQLDTYDSTHGPRLRAADIDAFIERHRIQPGQLSRSNSAVRGPASANRSPPPSSGT